MGECALPHPPRAARPQALPRQGEGKKRHADCAGLLDAREGSGGGEEGRSQGETDTSTCRLSAWIEYDTQCRPQRKFKKEIDEFQQKNFFLHSNGKKWEKRFRPINREKLGINISLS